MSDTATVNEINNKEDVNDSKSSQSTLENAQSAETKKKPGPKPKIKTEDTKSENIASKEEKYAETKNEPENGEKESEDRAETRKASESVVIAKEEVKKESSKESVTSEFVPAHILQRCPVYRTPSTKGAVLIMASGFVFCEKTPKDGFYKVKYNSFERGAKVGYVESKYIVFGAKNEGR